MVDYKQILKIAIEAQYLSPQEANEIFATVQKLQQQNLEVPFEKMLAKYIVTEQWMDLKKRINSSVQKTQHHARNQPPKKQMVKSAFDLEKLKISQDQVDRYTIIKTLGQGAMGNVYLAHDTKYDRQVALKTMLPNLENSEIAVKRFLQEAQTMQLLHNPNIIKIYEFGQSGKDIYLSMQYVKGAPLSDLIPKKMSMLKIAEIMAKTARALDYAHSKKIIHRDIKPSNIMIEKDNPILMDFGLAKEIQGNAKLTKTGAMLGTPSYMAPEQVKAQRREIDNQTDIWALGVSMYEMLTTRLPFPGNQHFAVMRKIVNEEPVPPTALNPLVSKDLEKICLKAMAKNKRHRYASAMDIAEDLECFLSGQEIPIRKTAKRSKKSFLNRFYFVVCAVLLIVLPIFFSHTSINDLKQKNVYLEQKNVSLEKEKKQLKKELKSLQEEKDAGQNSDDFIRRFIEDSRNIYHDYGLSTTLIQIQKVIALMRLKKSEQLLHSLEELFESSCKDESFYVKKIAFSIIVNICKKKIDPKTINEFEKLLAKMIFTYFPPMRKEDTKNLRKYFSYIKSDIFTEVRNITEKINRSDEQDKESINQLTAQIEESKQEEPYKSFLLSRISYVLEDEKYHSEMHEKKIFYAEKALSFFPNHPRYLYLKESYRKSQENLKIYQEVFKKEPINSNFFKKLDSDIKKKLKNKH